MDRLLHVPQLPRCEQSVSFEPSDNDARGDRLSLGEAANCRGTEVRSLNERLVVFGRQEKVAMELIGDLFIGPVRLTWVRLGSVEEILAPGRRQQMSCLVKEREPELIVGLVAEAQLDDSLVPKPPSSAAEMRAGQFWHKDDYYTRVGAHGPYAVKDLQERLTAGEGPDLTEHLSGRAMRRANSDWIMPRSRNASRRISPGGTAQSGAHAGRGPAAMVVNHLLDLDLGQEGPIDGAVPRRGQGVVGRLENQPVRTPEAERELACTAASPPTTSSRPKPASGSTARLPTSAAARTRAS